MALVEGKQVHVGNEKLFQRLNLFSDLGQVDVDIAEEWANSGGSVGFISIEGEGIVGAYCVADRIRNEAEDVVKSLQRMGIGVTISCFSGAGGGGEGSAAVVVSTGLLVCP